MSNKIRWGVLGGGSDSLIGVLHRVAELDKVVRDGYARFDFHGTHLAIAQVFDRQDVTFLDTFHEAEQAFVGFNGAVRT